MDNLRKGILIKNNVAVGAVGDKYFSSTAIGVIQAFSGNTIPRGFLVCNGASYKVADYPDLYAVIGNTYGGDTENFNVPNLVDKFIQGSTTSGEEKEAGLPNITGGFYSYSYFNGTPSGAITTSVENRNQSQPGGDNMRTYLHYLLDASRSSSVYGNSETVQPPALTMVYIIKAFHTNEGVDSKNEVSDPIIEYVDNAIAGIEDYSTEETLTGGKWVDGKPIYRKVFTAEVLASDNIPNARLLIKLNIDATNISQFILIKGIIKVKGINKYVECGGSYYVGDEPQLSTTMAYDGSDILLVLKNGTIGVEWMVNKDLELKAIVEYTKTTD